MSELGHVHQFRKPYVFRDFCHTTAVEKTCRLCGAVVVDYTIRDFGLNPLQIAFADPDCMTCRELAHGYEPDCWLHCNTCGCDLTEQESRTCAVCYAQELSFP